MALMASTALTNLRMITSQRLEDILKTLFQLLTTNIKDIFLKFYDFSGFYFFCFFYFFIFLVCPIRLPLFFHYIQVFLCNPSSIRCRGLNPRPLDREPSALTTRPWLSISVFAIISTYLVM